MKTSSCTSVTCSLLSGSTGAVRAAVCIEGNFAVAIALLNVYGLQVATRWVWLLILFDAAFFCYSFSCCCALRQLRPWCLQLVCAVSGAFAMRIAAYHCHTLHTRGVM